MRFILNNLTLTSAAGLFNLLIGLTLNLLALLANSDTLFVGCCLTASGMILLNLD